MNIFKYKKIEISNYLGYEDSPISNNTKSVTNKKQNKQKASTGVQSSARKKKETTPKVANLEPAVSNSNKENNNFSVEEINKKNSKSVKQPLKNVSDEQNRAPEQTKPVNNAKEKNTVKSRQSIETIYEHKELDISVHNEQEQMPNIKQEPVCLDEVNKYNKRLINSQDNNNSLFKKLKLTPSASSDSANETERENRPDSPIKK